MTYDIQEISTLLAQDPAGSIKNWEQGIVGRSLWFQQNHYRNTDSGSSDRTGYTRTPHFHG